MQTSESFVCCKKCLPRARTNIQISRHNFTKHNFPTQSLHNPPSPKHPWHGRKVQSKDSPQKNYQNIKIRSTPAIPSVIVTTATGENHQVTAVEVTAVVTGKKNHRPHLPRWPLLNYLVSRRSHLAVMWK